MTLDLQKKVCLQDGSQGTFTHSYKLGRQNKKSAIIYHAFHAFFISQGCYNSLIQSFPKSFQHSLFRERLATVEPTCTVFFCKTSTSYHYTLGLIGTFYTHIRTFVILLVPQTTLHQVVSIKSLTESPMANIWPMHGQNLVQTLTFSIGRLPSMGNTQQET